MTFCFDPREGGFGVGIGGGETWVTVGKVGSTWSGVTGIAGPGGNGGGLTSMPPGPMGGGLTSPLISTEVGERGKESAEIGENKPFLGFFKSLDFFVTLSFLMSYFTFLTASAISFAPILGLGLTQNDCEWKPQKYIIIIIIPLV